MGVWIDDPQGHRPRFVVDWHFGVDSNLGNGRPERYCGCARVRSRRLSRWTAIRSGRQINYYETVEAMLCSKDLKVLEDLSALVDSNRGVLCESLAVTNSILEDMPWKPIKDEER